jgi:hypothetical protein
MLEVNNINSLGNTVVGTHDWEGNQVSSCRCL